MGMYIVIKPDGTQTKVPGGKKLELSKLYELIGCSTVERTPVQFEHRARDCWLDEEGLLTDKPQWNRYVREYAIDYWRKRGVGHTQVQHFAGIGVIWLPNG